MRSCCLMSRCFIACDELCHVQMLSWRRSWVQRSHTFITYLNFMTLHHWILALCMTVLNICGNSLGMYMCIVRASCQCRHTRQHKNNTGSLYSQASLALHYFCTCVRANWRIHEIGEPGWLTGFCFLSIGFIQPLTFRHPVLQVIQAVKHPRLRVLCCLPWFWPHMWTSCIPKCDQHIRTYIVRINPSFRTLRYCACNKCIYLIVPDSS